MNFRRYIKIFFSTQVILSIAALLILAHLFLLAIYTQEHKSTLHTVARDAMIHRVMNIIHMVEALKPDQLNQALRNLDMPNGTLVITDKPLWHAQTKELNFWKVNALIPQDATTIRLSLQIPDGNWINIQCFITKRALWQQSFLLFLELLIAITLLFYAWSIHRFTKPLKEFKNAAERLGVDFKTTPLAEYQHAPVVVRETAQAMNRMQKRIRELIDDRTLLLAAISHDLRTPITRLRLRSDLIDDREIYTKNLRDLDEMENMIAEILTFARNDVSDEKKIKLDLNSFLQSLCDELTDLNYPITYHSSQNRVPFIGRPLSLKRVFNNLINNALKYGKTADIHLSTTADHIIITIDDEGPGIPEKELEQVFAPFYRCDNSRSREIAGTGLGLSVARDAILAHSGTITLKNREGKGLRVEIVL